MLVPFAGAGKRLTTLLAFLLSWPCLFGGCLLIGCLFLNLLKLHLTFRSDLWFRWHFVTWLIFCSWMLPYLLLTLEPLSQYHPLSGPPVARKVSLSIYLALRQIEGSGQILFQGSRLTFQLSSLVASDRFDFTSQNIFSLARLFLHNLMLCSICLIFSRVKYCKHASL